MESQSMWSFLVWLDLHSLKERKRINILWFFAFPNKTPQKSYFLPLLNGMIMQQLLYFYNF